MKLSNILGASLAVEAVSAAALQPRHYTFPALAGTSDWQYVRTTANYQSNAGLQDVTSPQLRCYTTGTRGASTQTVSAGSTVTFKSNPGIFHPGPLQFYMAKAPAGQDINTWDGSGNVWFKIYSDQMTMANGQPSWPNMNANSFPVTIPRATPSGDYLLRIEHIALHQASQANGAQLYISCAQIKVTNGGSGNPGPLVSFPGAYKASDPGLQVNIWNMKGGYTAPGPAVWTG